MVPDHNVFFLDPNRCIGCQACVHACSECDTHKGHSMIHLEFVDRALTTQTVPVVCMHCDSPTCAEVCPADAIKKTGDGVVQSARKHTIREGDWVVVESRRGSLTVRCQVVTTIRPDVVFVPYHWSGAKSVNLATIAAQDPISKIPEFKVCAVRVRKAGVPAYAAAYEPQQ